MREVNVTALQSACGNVKSSFWNRNLSLWCMLFVEKGNYCKKNNNKLRVQVRDVLGVYMDVARHGGLYWESSLAPLTLKCLNQLFSETLWINKRVEENLGTLFAFAFFAIDLVVKRDKERILHTRKWWFQKCKGPYTLGQANTNERCQKKSWFFLFTPSARRICM